MASFPEVDIPPLEEQYDPEEEGNDEQYTKKARVDTNKIFKKPKKPQYKVQTQTAEISMPEPVVKEIEVLEDESVSVAQRPTLRVPPEGEVDPMLRQEVNQLLSEEEKTGKVAEVKETILHTGQVAQQTIGQQKKKRKMTQKQLEALARGREKSLANRQARAKTKTALKEVSSLGVETSEQVAPASTPTPIGAVPQINQRSQPPTHYSQPQNNYLTKDDIKDISVQAITQYDAIRKARKKKKAEQKAVHIADRQTTQQIQRALNPNDMDFYSQCFNISY